MNKYEQYLVQTSKVIEPEVMEPEIVEGRTYITWQQALHRFPEFSDWINACMDNGARDFQVLRGHRLSVRWR